MKKLIGKGAFSRAYQVSENKVELHSTCPAKECYALFSQDNPLSPVIEKEGFNRNGKPVYIMPLYPKVKAPKKQLNKKSYSLYKSLKDAFNCSTIADYYWFYSVTQQLASDNKISIQDMENLQSLADSVGNAIDPKDMRFEISPRNITHDENGNLVLLDCFFSLKTLKITRGF